jgi:selenocysteine lyase/cysteine desulfurase
MVPPALGAEPDEIALVENATVGINIVANGVAWQPGDRVILTADEHPGNRIPWYNAADRYGIELVFLDIAGDDDEKLLRDFEALLTASTRLVAVSHVSRRTGRRLPGAALTASAHRRGIPVLLDGAQAFGAIPVDVHELNCDFYVFSGHKYIMGPQGTGGFYVRRDRIDWLKPSWVGSHSQSWMDDAGNMTLHAAAKRFEFGTRNLADQIGFGTALDFWEKTGWNRGFAKIAAYTDQLKTALADISTLALKTPQSYDQSSGIVTVQLPGVDARALCRRLLEEERILIAPIEGEPGSIRISTHVFNNKEEMQRLLDALRREVRFRQQPLAAGRCT